MNPARFFSTASLAFGIVLAIISPPFCAPDEPAHLYRAWSIACGRFSMPQGDHVPKSLVASARQMLRMTRGAETGRVTIAKLREVARIPLRENDTVFVPVPADVAQTPLAYTAPSYTPAGYLPTAAAIAIGRVLHLPPVVLLYAGRMANLATATALIAWAIAIIPFGRWALALASLTPMAVFLRASLGIDALLFASAVALIAALVAARPGAAVFFTLLVCTIKPGYALMPLFILAIPKLRRGAVVLAVFLAIVGGSALDAMFIRNANPTMTPRVNTRAAAIVRQPLAFAKALERELHDDAKLLTIETVAYFGWLDAPAPLVFALLWCGVLIAIAAIDGSSTLSPFARLFGLALFVAEVIALVTLLHLATGGTHFMRGLQGRYVLPLLPLVLLPLTSISIADEVKVRLTQLMVAIGVLQSVWVIVTRYWV